MKTSNNFRLFKRGDDGKEMPPSAEGYAARSYYFRFTFRGKAYPRCLETTNATEAQRRAKAKYNEIVAAVSTGEYKRLDATKLRQEHTATAAELFAAYRTGPAEAGAETRAANLAALKQLAGDSFTLRELTPALARAAFERATVKIMAETDQQRIASLKRSANSRWLQARSLFTDKMLSYYLDRHLISSLASLEAFVRAGNLAMFTRIPRQNYNPPGETIIAQTLEAWLNLGRTGTHRDLFLAIGHELAFGLRKGEMAQARWPWHTARNGYPVLDGTAAVKNGSGLLQVRALDPWFTQLQTLATAQGWWLAGPNASDDLIINGTLTYRSDDLYRAISDWMWDLGWRTKKTNHALRAYAGSQVAMRYGIYEAQMWLRHASVKVTEANYSHFVTKFKPAAADSIAARWATAGTPENIGPNAGIIQNLTSAAKDVTCDASQMASKPQNDFRQTPLNSSHLLPWKLETRN